MSNYVFLAIAVIVLGYLAYRYKDKLKDLWQKIKDKFKKKPDEVVEVDGEDLDGTGPVRTPEALPIHTPSIYDFLGGRPTTGVNPAPAPTTGSGGGSTNPNIPFTSFGQLHTTPYLVAGEKYAFSFVGDGTPVMIQVSGRDGKSVGFSVQLDGGVEQEVLSDVARIDVPDSAGLHMFVVKSNSGGRYFAQLNLRAVVVPVPTGR